MKTLYNDIISAVKIKVCRFKAALYKLILVLHKDVLFQYKRSAASFCHQVAAWSMGI
jgi:hypothetical protein